MAVVLAVAALLSSARGGFAGRSHAPARLLHSDHDEDMPGVVSMPMGGHTHNIVNWTIPLGTQHLHGEIGDMFQFQAMGPCDLYQFSTEAGYNSCDFSGATLVSNLSATSIPPFAYIVTVESNDTLRFASKTCTSLTASKAAVNTTACASGLKAHVHVASEAPLSPPSSPGSGGPVSPSSSPALTSPPPPKSGSGLRPSLPIAVLLHLLLPLLALSASI